MIVDCVTMGDPYHQYYYRQATGSGLPVYSGVSVQRGYGLGGLLAAGLKSVLPGISVKGIGKALVGQAMKSAQGVMSDLFRGKSLKSSVKDHALSAGKTLGKRALAQVGLIGPASAPPRKKRRRQVSTKRSVGRKKVQSGKGRRRGRRTGRRRGIVRRKVIRRRRRKQKRGGGGGRRKKRSRSRRSVGPFGSDIFS